MQTNARRQGRLTWSRGPLLAGGLAGLLLAVTLAVLPTAAAQDDPPVVFEGARLIPGDGSAPVDDSAFVVRNGRIQELGARTALRAPRGARRVDLRGTSVMPLIIDVHGHIGYMKDGTTGAAQYSRENVLDHLRRYLYYGVGAMQSLGTDRNDVELWIRNEQQAGTLKDPDLALLFTAGQGLVAPTPGQANGGPAFAPDVVHETISPDDGRQFVRALAIKKPDIVKVWVDDRNRTKVKLAPELYRPIIDEAHAQGLRAVAHVYYLDDAKELARAGVDGFAHMVRDRPLDDEALRLFKARDLFACTTMSVQRGDGAAWIDDPALAETVQRDVIAKWKSTLSQSGPRPVPPGYAVLEDSARKLHAAGVRMVLCGDTGFAMQVPGFTEHRELKGLVDAGIPPLEAIRIATHAGAAVLGLADRGSLARGKRADFMVLEGDPIADITNSRRIRAVYRDGRAVDRAAARARWNGTAR